MADIRQNSGPVSVKKTMRNRKKTTHPMLMLMQRGSYKSRNSEFLRQNSTDGKCMSSPTAEGKMASPSGNVCEYHASQTSPNVAGSFDSSWPELGSPSASEKCESWIDKVSRLRRMSSGLSRGLCFSSPLSPSDLSSRPSLSIFSSSYTSWTRPFAGQNVSDSYCPASSILDNDDNDDNDDIEQEEDGAHNERKQRRKSSADTCKDIDDIEDFELDAFNESDVTDEDDIVFPVDPIKEGKDKRLSGVMSSPDMAYGSMHGDFDHQDGD
jgi:hypothetical protein